MAPRTGGRKSGEISPQLKAFFRSACAPKRHAPKLRGLTKKKRNQAHNRQRKQDEPAEQGSEVLRRSKLGVSNEIVSGADGCVCEHDQPKRYDLPTERQDGQKHVGGDDETKGEEE